jgi:hypothetical protein
MDMLETMCKEAVVVYFKAVSTNYVNSVASVRKRTKTTERPPYVGEVSANFCG